MCLYHAICQLQCYVAQPSAASQLVLVCLDRMRKLLCTQVLDNVIIVASVTMHDPRSVLAFLSDLHTHDWFVAHTAVEKQ